MVEHGNHPGLNEPADSITASLTPRSASQPPSSAEPGDDDAAADLLRYLGRDPDWRP
jgi:hypothetical protein